MVRTLGSKGYTAGHLRVGPDLAFKWFDLENFVLEQHLVFINRLFDRCILAGQSRQDLLLFALTALLQFKLVVGVI